MKQVSGDKDEGAEVLPVGTRIEFEEIALASRDSLQVETKHRRDLTPEDFRILKRFKHHMHRLASAGKIQLREWIAPIIYEQAWYLTDVGWLEHNKKERLNYLCYVLEMRDFRDIVRAVIKDIGTGTEGFVIVTLKRLSMILFREENGHWKWDGKQEVVLEYERLSPEEGAKAAKEWE